MRLQKPPQGLLGALDLKTDGQNPSEFSDVLIPNVEVYDQYLATQLQIVTGSFQIVAPASGGAVSLTPGSANAWRVLGFGFIALTGGLDVGLTSFAGVSVAAVGALGAAVVITENRPLQALDPGVGVGRALGFYLPRPLFLPSGFVLSGGVGFSAAPALAINVDFRALVQAVPL